MTGRVTHPKRRVTAATHKPANRTNREKIRSQSCSQSQTMSRNSGTIQEPMDEVTNWETETDRRPIDGTANG